MRSNSATLLWTTALLFLAGCGESRPPLAVVRGVINFDGKPLNVGSVMFIPDKGKYAYGEIQPDGTYTLTTFEPNDGALIGRHRVAVTAVKGGADEAATPITPSKYSSEQTSGLEAEVKEGTENVLNFELTSKGSKKR